jgi:hypothetical protein
MSRRTVFLFLVLSFAVSVFADDQAPKTLRVCFVGNSVTDTINYRGLWPAETS